MNFKDTATYCKHLRQFADEVRAQGGRGHVAVYVAARALAQAIEAYAQFRARDAVEVRH